MLPSGSVSIPLEVSSNGRLQKPTSSFSWSLPSYVTSITAYTLYYAFYNTGITSVDLSSLITVSGQSAMQYAFSGCDDLTNVDLSNLTTIGQGSMGEAFSYCKSLTSISFPSLINMAQSALGAVFRGCTSLTTLAFPSLNSNSFGQYTSQFDNMLLGVTGCAVHFPSNLQSVIGSWSSVTSGFGGTNTTVLFDLPATE